MRSSQPLQDCLDEDRNRRGCILFKGNSDGNSIHSNTFQTPIIAQYIRINPTRWRDRISMRVELYGCDYVSATLSFNGTSIVYRNLTQYPIRSRRDVINFRFRTALPDGVLIYSKGTQSDYFALQLVDNRMVLNVNLGSNVMTSVTAGSLLDDNLWHDVTINRFLDQVSFTVDRVEVKETIKGDFMQLDLDKILYIGAVPNPDEGLIIAKNFTGCIENFYLNETNVIFNLKSPPYDEEWNTFYKNYTMFNCPETNVVPVTFLPGSSQRTYVKLKGYEGVQRLNITFEFRTYQDYGVLVYHKFTSVGFFKIYFEKSKLLVEMATDTTPRLILDNFPDLFNDGLWHRVVFTISQNLITFSLDEREVKTTRLVKVFTGGLYYFGGLPPSVVFETSSSTTSSSNVNGGYVGCLRQISIDGNFHNPNDWKDNYCCKETLRFDSCQMLDRCNPNPCEHGSKCKQTSTEFECDCRDSGYTGATCHMPLHPLSCQAYRNVHGTSQKSEVIIDVDGSGPLKPFPVTCQYYHDGNTQTIIHHMNEDPTPVDGYEAPGSFRQVIQYDGDFPQIEAVINRSVECRQFIKYECKNSRLFNTPVPNPDIWTPNTWWVSRQNQPMDYWGDSLPGSMKCDCGILGTCEMPDKWCNCDSGLDTWLGDEGYLTDMTYLPVRELRIGDTGTVTDEKEGRYTLGALVCSGDNLYENVVTFRLADAALTFPTPNDLSHSWDIYFEFKTTTLNAVILHSKGVTDYIKVEIISGNLIKFQLESGSGPMGVNIQTSAHLNDNQWHSVHVEKNRKQARLVVDGSQSSTVQQPAGQVRAIELHSELYVGSGVDFRDGYVGCLRALMVNGIMLDMKVAAEAQTYGIGTGCFGKCDSGPCLNNGTCTEGYDHYDCDCRFTAFKGPICADEIGINLQSNSLVKYEFRGSYKSTIAEKFRVGFTTTEPRGFLLGVFSNKTGEYLTLMVSNSGHLRLVFDFGFERQELIFPDQNFATGQYHDVQISRMDSGTKLVMKVDNFEPKIFTFDVKASADAQFNNIEYLYIGKNETMKEGFVGCISRVEFDDIYPLKYYFQEDRPKNIYSYPETLVEDFCSVEPVTHPTEIPEVRPAPKLDEEKIRRIYRNTQSAVLGAVLAILFLLIVIMAILIGRYMSQHKGEYLTQEDEGAMGCEDPNDAVVRGHTGHHVEKRREYPL
ncbi:unnamed protein product [Orchesella dallaii]|uniref:Neurexin-4 n=1 Tax=Orchesella dallaii TaxID=48710 RepID=A0ABP1R9Q3_9HEXA